ncbi:MULTISPECIES: type III secretion system export apparatus subunit SctS [Pseudomonas]|uniref:Type III secretion protein n=3 Tax=Pseudomonas TaxID=286 RepID=A0A0X1SYQ0_PSEAA|nr:MULTISPECIES: type III secretion system export apparatus subunit SctS [Pseudomonas]AMB84954.1 type III secretion protein [Pseudomonas agarici]NVZ24399.1 type III secretion system export apparatus subunit SctS [Pseudomonas gingeri]NVZ66945.1 type III secretion system export apparatus subunit SctS [Pseudomonas gingeri]NVZ78269.1 type III secretion system export apparatus subunit SctS [Pseudomonas gingeri]NWA02254.1 type III secretion system export apparatus subunit SctS [Pseudomonas gingeri]
MGQDVFLGLMKQALMTVLLLSAPALGVAIIIGLSVGLFQALTQIQDQTLPQVVKLVAVLLVIVFVGPLLAGQVMELGNQVLDNFPLWTR